MAYKNSRTVDVISSSVLHGVVAVSLGVLLLAGTSAHADASCTALVQSKVAYIQQYGGFYYMDMSMHREDVSWVSYSSGLIGWDQVGSGLTGNSNQIFSDRRSGSQPFDINQQDQLSFDLSSNGLLHIHSITWGFDTYWDMSCQGELVTRYFPGFGTITLAFRGWSIIF